MLFIIDPHSGQGLCNMQQQEAPAGRDEHPSVQTMGLLHNGATEEVQCAVRMSSSDELTRAPSLSSSMVQRPDRPLIRESSIGGATANFESTKYHNRSWQAASSNVMTLREALDGMFEVRGEYTLAPTEGHNYIGHNFIGHNYIGP